MSKSADLMRETLGMVPAGALPPVNNSPDSEEEKPVRPPAKLEITVKPSTLDNEVLKNNDLAQDYVYARNLTHTMIQLVGDQLAGAAIVASETEHPRAYGVFNELAGTMRNIIQDLLALQKVFKEVKRDDPYVAAGMPEPPAPTQVIGTQNVFTGTTTDILRVMEQHQSSTIRPTILDIGDAAIEETGRDDRVSDVEVKPDGSTG